MDKLKNTLVVFMVTMLAVSVASLAPRYVYAGAESTCNNVDQDSFCDSEATDDDHVYPTVTNVGQNLTNFDLAFAGSGFNQQNGNEDDNEIVADDSDADYETQNFLNATEITADDGATASNDNITDNSDGDTFAQDNDTVHADVANRDSRLRNFTISAAFSGGNSQNNNDDENSTHAGGSSSYAFAGNVQNSTLVTTGNSSHASNDTVNQDSFADAEAYDNDHVNVGVTNKTTRTNNLVVAGAVSGANSQNGNEDDNEIVTDNSTAGAGAENFVNVTEVTANGSADASNTNITDNSDGDATSTDNDTVTVKATNRDTKVRSGSIAVALSGGNTQNHNDDENSTQTGQSTAGGSTSNMVNTTQVHY